MLEKIFFHDVINIAGGLKGITDILITAQSHHETEEYIKLVNKMGNELLEEIMSQRALSFAETGELQPIVTQVSSSQILKETSYYLSHHTIAQFKKILVAPDATNIIISTAEVLLKRVLINMLKNALEACNPGDEIKLDCKVAGDEVIFKVHNDGFMSEQVQAQIFQRSFSTHGQGRGLGTYSIKLLTEHYLNGSVGFSSTKDHGTEFYIKIPKK
jgi:signal transduction histidine kinase